MIAETHPSVEDKPSSIPKEVGLVRPTGTKMMSEMIAQIGDEESSSSESFHSLPAENEPAFLSLPSVHRISSPKPREICTSTTSTITASDSKVMALHCWY